jgi:glycosyltransferase involved in cell wall biosynthesis
MGNLAGADMARLGAFRNKMWTWGYFLTPPSASPAARSNAGVKLLWAGRMLKLKGIDVLVKALGRLREKGIKPDLDLIGEGPESQSIERLVRQLGLEERVHFHAPMRPDEVFERMKRADIYVFPSQESEGWGAVVNEAMSAGCVTVASRECGAGPVLIEDGVNGFLFHCNEPETLATILETSIGDSALRARLGRCGWETMRSVWSPSAAAGRLACLCESFATGAGQSLHARGPCSKLPA